ncbi:invertase recombinase-like protein [Pyxidicoccus parkwayensis]|uniref:Invertase recombinase-like protein n=1 Tax=Pyxidicoccus parkwayensis TaxID=2813578 RepID=A0ABX7NKH6_9BACT|nr:invertase recombinase-like protein [Pyxidicoccus parkwaysis]QSQ19143.1 invertase recombinase-like protein [Pyxidicoccus parkwaysis]
MTLFRVCLTSLLVIVVACGDSNPEVTPDDGQALPDAGNGTPDAGNGTPDAGSVTPDAGNGTPDAGDGTPDAGDETPDAGNQTSDAGNQTSDAGNEAPDAGNQTSDAGNETPDAGNQTSDAGNETPDAGNETPDAGSGTSDAGSGTSDAGSGTPDAGQNPDVSVIDNWGFEEWPGALPSMWFGSKSNIDISGVQKVTTNAFEGLNAVRLTNSSSTHRRFTTLAKSMRAGRYSCTFQARGTGDVRNAFFSDDYSTYSGYTSVDTTQWTRVAYNFNLANDVFDTFELIFSVRNTSGENLLIDDVRCARAAEPCDTVSCEAWERCENTTATCEPLSGRCNDATDCSEWQACDATHTCVVAENRCVRHADCAGTPATPVCDSSTHLCVAGDPCAGVTCSNSAMTCNPTTGVCELAEGACFTTYDCHGDLPACDPTTRRCVAASHPANIIRNGGFENWNTYSIPYYGDHYIPDYWYGLDNGVADPGTEIKPTRLVPYTIAVHGGSRALQFVVPIQVAERFSSEKFNVPSGNYSCSYRVRGHGSIRHRSYSSGGWSTQTDFLTVDSDEWQAVYFRFTGNVRDWRLFFYPSRSEADRGHLQVDDVVCTKD